MSTTYLYTGYGLTLQVPFPCPILPPAPTGTRPDVVVEAGPVPRSLAAPLAGEETWEAEFGRFLYRGGQRAGRFLVEGGGRIVLERNPGADDQMVAHQFLHVVLAAVLRHRGLLVLHADAAATPNGAVVIGGESGAGKSTTAGALLARGCDLLSDDVTAVAFGKCGRPEVTPGVPHVHLTEESAVAVGRDVSGLPRPPWRRMKAAVPVHTGMATAPAPLRTLFVLGTHHGTDVRVTNLSGAAKFAAVDRCVYGPVLAPEHPRHFEPLAALADHVDVLAIDRPQGRWSIDEVVGLILGNSGA